MDLNSIIQSFERGEEPFLFKLINGTASPEQINEWTVENKILIDDSLISELKTSFNLGTKLAETLDANLQKQSREIDEISRSVEKHDFDKEMVLLQLENISDRLNSIQDEVVNLLNIIKKN